MEWDWVAAAAIFGLVVCAVIGFWAPRKVSIAERIGGHIVTVPHGRVIDLGTGEPWLDNRAALDPDWEPWASTPLSARSLVAHFSPEIETDGKPWTDAP